MQKPQKLKKQKKTKREMKIMRAATASDLEARTNNAYCERSARQPGKRSKEIRHVDALGKSKSKVAGGWSGAERSARERKKAQREGGGGTGGGGRRKSYARERDLRELSSAERSRVILHNDG